MTRCDRKIFFTASTFIAVITKKGNGFEQGSVPRIGELAELLDKFCIEYVLCREGNKVNGQDGLLSYEVS